MTKGLEFDPGFGPYVMAFQGTVEYLYSDINRFSVFSQRKIKFRQYYKKILDVFNNNLGFYVGCLMWAAYIKLHKNQPILNNECFGQKFDETENTSETDFMIRFVELFPKDMKYFIGANFEFDKNVMKVLETYKEFLTINEGFVSTQTSDDIKLPSKLKTEGADTFKEKIDSVIKTKDLSKLLEYQSMVI